MNAFEIDPYDCSEKENSASKTTSGRILNKNNKTSFGLDVFSFGIWEV
ncbi:hypothetical protein JQK62_12740 [Leptospira santarosai]|nr:hypothetical protein [Leptospira santarosai]